MKITEAQIERYFNNECDLQERQAISDYFIRHPEVLKKYLTEQSWETFETEETVTKELSKKMLFAIRANTYAQQRQRNIRRLWASAAAAVLVLSAGTVYFTQFRKAKQENIVAANEPKPSLPAIRYQRTVNSTTKTLSLVLEDSSQVVLSPNSELVYPLPFNHDRRSIVLKGEARFDVAKDQLRPFTVYAGQLATTALGTVFSISAFEGKNVRVRLLSGKVRVEADSILAGKGIGSAILLPGQQLRLNAQHQLVVTNLKEKLRKTSAPVLPASKPTTSKELMVFHNEALENIFKRLAEQFKTNIQFRPEQLTGMSFTGKFDPEKETLSAFIQTISLLNNLSVVHENGAIQITVQ